MKTEQMLSDKQTAPLGVVFSDLLGRSLPSQKYGAWIVDEIRGSRARLITANQKGEQWMDVETLKRIFAIMDQESPNIKAEPSAPETKL